MFKSAKFFDFYGVWNNKFKLDDQIWEALEDPDDGYRSYLETILATSDGSNFFHMPVAKVFVKKVDCKDFIGYLLVDVITGHIWLEVVTNYSDSCYPMFIFRYDVPAPVPTFDEFIGFN